MCEEIYARARSEFGCGLLYKPGRLNTNTLAARLAPLFIQEANTNRHANPLPGARSVSRQTPGSGHIRFIVYTREANLTIGGQTHTEVVYLWRTSPSPSRNGDSVEGIRMILDSGGQPVIWAVLEEDTSFRRIFVAESLEKATAAQYGNALAGRRHAVEPDLERHARVIVPRILDDGPMPMGPIVYLEADSGAVTTVACRCMPAQVRQLLGSQEYELRPLSDLFPELDSDAETAGWIRKQIGPVFEEATADKAFETGLRLPDSF